MIFQGILTSTAKEPYIFVIIQVGSGPPVPPSGSAHKSFISLGLILPGDLKKVFLIDSGVMSSISVRLSLLPIVRGTR